MTTTGTRSTTTDAFASARAVADAVLYEGYLLYPYRRSSPKNRIRWQFGVLAPRPWIEFHAVPDPGVAGAAESWFQQAGGLAEAHEDAVLRTQVRFLQLQRRQVYESGADGTLRPVDELDADGRHELTFDEALPREYEFAFRLGDLLGAEQEVLLDVPGEQTTASLTGPGGQVGSVERTSWPLAARVTLRAAHADAPFSLLRVEVRVENVAPLDDPTLERDGVLRRSLLATHLLLGLDRGRFVSLLDPPEWASPAAAGCHNRHVFPVLAGTDEGADVLLCSPIILYDHPKVAPESPGDLHDAAEIDEILSLRTMTLTEAEKREARATDPRSAAIVDRVDAMPPELLAKLHGVIRDLQPEREPDLADNVLVAGVRIGAGSLVRLRPRGRGADAHDMFFAGRVGRVHEILHDVDGSVRLAVTIDGDPAADLHEWYGRFFHFTPDEVEPIEVAQ